MKKVLNRIILIFPAILFKILWYLVLLTIVKDYIPLFVQILSIISVILVLYIVCKREESSYKIIWLILILVFPIFGAWLYLQAGNKSATKHISKKIEKSKKSLPIIKTQKKVLKSLQDDNLRLSQTLSYISNDSGFPITNSAKTKYFSLGEEMFEDMLLELEKAEKFIFLEYFIIEEGKFFNAIIDILEQKVKDGVDVRLIYDDFGSITTYSYKNLRKLKDKGIKCLLFNPLIFIKAHLNNRDHRKMLIIDNKVVYSGGINLADEYINVKEKHGHWKDIGFKLSGTAVKNYTYMFIELWNAFSNKKINTSILENTCKDKANDNAYILSYYDSPVDEKSLSNNLYIELLNDTKKSITFYTPYLILSDSLMDAFIRTAKRGVDIKIIIPGIPDKKIVYRITRSYCKELIKYGIKIYEYTPGFLHAKACLSDDEIGVIGTVNLDYRSLFLHFECNSIFYKDPILKDLKKDFTETMKLCKRLELKDFNNKIINRIVDAILRLFAPLC